MPVAPGKKLLKYGRGIAFPFRLDGTGDIAVAEEEELAAGDIDLMLGVRKGELPWDMDLGSALADEMDESVDEVADAALKLETRRVLLTEKRMVPSSIEVLRTVSPTEPHGDEVQLKVKVTIISQSGAPLLTDIESVTRLR